MEKLPKIYEEIPLRGRPPRKYPQKPPYAERHGVDSAEVAHQKAWREVVIERMGLKCRVKEGVYNDFIHRIMEWYDDEHGVYFRELSKDAIKDTRYK